MSSSLRDPEGNSPAKVVVDLVALDQTPLKELGAASLPPAQIQQQPSEQHYQSADAQPKTAVSYVHRPLYEQESPSPNLMITPSAADYSNFKGGKPNKSSNLLDDQFVPGDDVFAESVKEDLRKRNEEKSSAGKSSSSKKKRALSSNFLEIKVEQTDPQTPINPQSQRPTHTPLTARAGSYTRTFINKMPTLCAPLSPAQQAMENKFLAPCERDRMQEQIRQLKKTLWQKEAEYSKDKALWLQKYELTNNELSDTKDRLQSQKNYYQAMFTSMNNAGAALPQESLFSSIMNQAKESEVHNETFAAQPDPVITKSEDLEARAKIMANNLSEEINRTKVEQLQERIAKLNDRVRDLDTEAKKAKAKFEEAKKLADAKVDHCSKLQKKLEQAQADARQKHSLSEAEAKKLKKEVGALKAELETSKNEGTVALSELESLKTELSQTKKKLYTLQKEKKRAIDQIESQLEALMQRDKENKAALQEAKAQADGHEQELEKKECVIRNLEDSLKKAASNARLIADELKQTKADLAESEQLVQRLEDQLRRRAGGRSMSNRSPLSIVNEESSQHGTTMVRSTSPISQINVSLNNSALNRSDLVRNQEVQELKSKILYQEQQLCDLKQSQEAERSKFQIQLLKKDEHILLLNRKMRETGSAILSSSPAAILGRKSELKEERTILQINLVGGPNRGGIPTGNGLAIGSRMLRQQSRNKRQNSLRRSSRLSSQLRIELEDSNFKSAKKNSLQKPPVGSALHSPKVEEVSAEKEPVRVRNPGNFPSFSIDIVDQQIQIIQAKEAKNGAADASFLNQIASKDPADVLKMIPPESAGLPNLEKFSQFFANFAATKQEEKRQMKRPEAAVPTAAPAAPEKKKGGVIDLMADTDNSPYFTIKNFSQDGEQQLYPEQNFTPQMPSWEPVAETAPLNEFNVNRDCALSHYQTKIIESDYPVYMVEESPQKKEADPGNLKNLSISEVSYLQNTTSHSDCAEVKVQIQSHVERGSTVAIPVPIGETPSNLSHVSANPSPVKNLQKLLENFSVYESALSRQLKLQNKDLAHSLTVPDEKARLQQEAKKSARPESSIAETRTAMGDDPSRLHESDAAITTSHILDFDGKGPAQNRQEGTRLNAPKEAQQQVQQDVSLQLLIHDLDAHKCGNVGEQLQTTQQTDVEECKDRLHLVPSKDSNTEALRHFNSTEGERLNRKKWPSRQMKVQTEPSEVTPDHCADYLYGTSPVIFPTTSEVDESTLVPQKPKTMRQKEKSIKQFTFNLENLKQTNVNLQGSPEQKSVGEMKRIGSVANLPKRSPHKTLFPSMAHKGSTPSLSGSKSLASFRNFEKSTPKPGQCGKKGAPGSVYKKIINGDIVKVSPKGGAQTSRGLMTCKNQKSRQCLFNKAATKATTKETLRKSPEAAAKSGQVGTAKTLLKVFSQHLFSSQQE